jgi:hypothetical protein
MFVQKSYYLQSLQSKTEKKNCWDIHYSIPPRQTHCPIRRGSEFLTVAAPAATRPPDPSAGLAILDVPNKDARDIVEGRGSTELTEGLACACLPGALSPPMVSLALFKFVAGATASVVGFVVGAPTGTRLGPFNAVPLVRDPFSWLADAVEAAAAGTRLGTTLLLVS